MNYLEQINGFWEKSESDDLTGNDIAVYFALLNYANRLHWPESFICHWEIVCHLSKVSKNTFYKSMQRLTELGYIDFRLGQKNHLKPKVFILKFENRKGTEREQKGNKEGIEREQKGNLIKQINSKQLNDKTIVASATNKFNFKKSLVDLGVSANLVDDWLAVRKNKKAANTETALNKFLLEVKKSNLTIEKVVEICAYKSWVGFQAEWMKEKKPAQIKDFNI